MKYKYRLVNKKLTENEDDLGGGEEDGLQKFELEKEYTLTVFNNAEEIKKILTTYDPETFRGSFVRKDKELKDEYYKKVFGFNVTNEKFNLKNSEIYKENGKNLYKKIEDTVGEKFDLKGKILRKDEKGNIIFVFPLKTPYNQSLVDKYFTKETEKTIKSRISPTMLNVVDSDTIKFPLPYGKEIKKILDKAGVEYKLKVTDKL